MMLSAITPSPTLRFIPSSPLYRERFNPCRLFRTLMRPSHPVRHFCSFLNQRCFCRCLRAGLLVAWLGIETRRTPISSAFASLAAEKNPGSAATTSILTVILSRSDRASRNSRTVKRLARMRRGFRRLRMSAGWKALWSGWRQSSKIRFPPEGFYYKPRIDKDLLGLCSKKPSSRDRL